MSELLRAVQVSKDYRQGSAVLRVLDGVDLEARPGEMVAVVGASGAGKSTLLHVLGLLDTPTGGQVFYGGTDLRRLGARDQACVRNRLFGFVFQFFHLFPDFTALENVMMPLMVGTPLLAWPGRRRAARRRAAELLESVGLAGRARHRPSQMSGGERQRVAIARAMVNEPEALFLDEPTGNLDSRTGAGIMDMIHRLRAERGFTVVMVTHDASLAAAADRIVRLRDGRIARNDALGAPV